MYAISGLRRVWRYQREEIRIRISKKNRQHNDQKKKNKRTSNDLHNIHIKLKIEDELVFSERVSSSCSTSGTRRVNIFTNPVISREWGKDREVLTTSGTYPWSFVTQIFHNGEIVMVTVKFSKWWFKIRSATKHEIKEPDYILVFVL